MSVSVSVSIVLIPAVFVVVSREVMILCRRDGPSVGSVRHHKRGSDSDSRRDRERRTNKHDNRKFGVRETRQSSRTWI
jgi:hypothetical protein